MATRILETSDAYEELEIRSKVGLMAYHGGTLEKATDAIARETGAVNIQIIGHVLILYKASDDNKIQLPRR